MDIVFVIQPWHWLVLGILLLLAEVMGAGGFLIGLAIAAFIESLVVVLAGNLSWDFQLMIFGFDGILFTWIYWKFFRSFNEKSDTLNINDRAAQYIGRTFELTEPIVHGYGKVKIGDSLWKVKAQTDAPEGVSVNVVDSEGMTLIVDVVGC